MKGPWAMWGKWGASVFPLVLLLVVDGCNALGRTLSDCQKVASAFANTCDTSAGPEADILSGKGEDVSCDGMQASGCAGTMSGSTCTWTRRLCVTCSEQGGTVRIRVQSNGLPKNCYSSPAPVQTFGFDFEVDFNTAVDAQQPRNAPGTQQEVNELLCDITRHSDRNIPSEVNFVKHGSANMQASVGMSVDGVVIMNPISAEGVDPFYPAKYGSVSDPDAVVEKVDVCLGHPQAAGMYHYHIMSPCTADPSRALVKPCNARSGCTDVASHALSGFTDKAKKLTIVGLAKDGHVIYGPYLDDGTEVTTGLDVCNGAVGLGECDDTYAYYATGRFPYFSGCFGGGSFPSFQPQCTTNPTTYKAGTPCSGKTPAPPQGSTPAPPATTPAPPTPPQGTTPAPGGGSGGSTSRPNFLVFMPDDFDFLWDECPPGYDYGTPVEQWDRRPPIPSLDRVRSEGMVFERAYTAGPKCAPSRFSLLTGRYCSRGSYAQWISGRQYDAEKRKRTYIEVPSTKIEDGDVTDNVQTALSRAGYETIHSGKWHMFRGSKEDGYWKDYPSLVADIEKTGFTTVASAYTTNMGNDGETDGMTKFSHNHEWMVATSLEAIDKVLGKKPFFLHFTPTGPHAPKTEAALFSFDEKATPAGMLGTAPQVSGMRSRQDLWSDAGGFGGNKAVQENWASHMWVDDALGALLSGLETRKVLDDTMVVVVMDHGMASKGHLYEGGTRVMQAVRYPPLLKAKTTKTVVANIDISATILDVAGVTPHYQLDGRSWREVMGGGALAKTVPKVNEMYLDRSVVAGKYKYISRSEINKAPASLSGMYPAFDDCEQLYDLETDGAEQKNLAADPQYGGVLWQFREYMKCHDEATAVSGGKACELPEITDELVTVGTLLTSPTQTGTQSGGAAGTQCTEIVNPAATQPPATPEPATSTPATTQSPVPTHTPSSPMTTSAPPSQPPIPTPTSPKTSSTPAPTQSPKSSTPAPTQLEGAAPDTATLSTGALIAIVAGLLL